MATDPERRSNVVLRFAGQVLVWMVILAALAVLGIAVLIPRVAGATPYTVVGGSMAPAMPAGSLVVVESVQPEEVGVGSVITYQLESGEPTVATHRVVGVRQSLSGERSFVTQGDANETPDREPVVPAQIRGERWYHVRHLGYVNNVLTGNQRQIVVYGAAALLLGYAGLMFTQAARDRIRTRDRPNPGEEEPAT